MKEVVVVKREEVELQDTSIVAKNMYLFSKRVVDIILSIVGIVCLLPVFIITAIAIRLESKGEIIFSQERIGLNGKLFKLYKFRTMINNADKELEKILKEDKELAKEYKLNKKLKNDPRITKVGNFIRKTSIDELPQLWNILKGEMSFIGNRPYLPREKEDMGKYYDDIIKIKPGLTGMWQVSGRSDTTFEFRCKLESEYSKSYSIRQDIKIFFKTFVVIFKGL